MGSWSCNGFIALEFLYASNELPCFLVAEVISFSSINHLQKVYSITMHSDLYRIVHTPGTNVSYEHKKSKMVVFKFIFLEYCLNFVTV